MELSTSTFFPFAVKGGFEEFTAFLDGVLVDVESNAVGIYANLDGNEIAGKAARKSVEDTFCDVLVIIPQVLCC